jgi:hypothetical protein
MVGTLRFAPPYVVSKFQPPIFSQRTRTMRSFGGYSWQFYCTNANTAKLNAALAATPAAHAPSNIFAASTTKGNLKVAVAVWFIWGFHQSGWG